MQCGTRPGRPGRGRRVPRCTGPPGTRPQAHRRTAGRRRRARPVRPGRPGARRPPTDATAPAPPGGTPCAWRCARRGSPRRAGRQAARPPIPRTAPPARCCAGRAECAPGSAWHRFEQPGGAAGGLRAAGRPGRPRRRSGRVSAQCSAVLSPSAPAPMTAMSVSTMSVSTAGPPRAPGTAAGRSRGSIQLSFGCRQGSGLLASMSPSGRRPAVRDTGQRPGIAASASSSHGARRRTAGAMRCPVSAAPARRQVPASSPSERAGRTGPDAGGPELAHGRPSVGDQELAVGVASWRRRKASPLGSSRAAAAGPWAGPARRHSSAGEDPRVADRRPHRGQRLAERSGKATAWAGRWPIPGPAGRRPRRWRGRSMWR